MRIIDLTGEKFGMLTVLKFIERKKVKNKVKYYWECVCDCGYVVIKERDTLKDKRHKVKSCGCYKVKIASEINKKHNMYKTRFYRIYKRMKVRINNKNTKEYKDYGGRGIKVSESWQNNFFDFKNDMYESYLSHVIKKGEKDTTLERIDVNGNYCKENCKWATYKEQNLNKRR